MARATTAAAGKNFVLEGLKNFIIYPDYHLDIYFYSLLFRWKNLYDPTFTAVRINSPITFSLRHLSSAKHNFPSTKTNKTISPKTISRLPVTNLLTGSRTKITVNLRTNLRLNQLHGFSISRLELNHLTRIRMALRGFWSLLRGRGSSRCWSICFTITILSVLIGTRTPNAINMKIMVSLPRLN